MFKVNEEKVVEFGAKLGSNKKLLSLRDGFAYTMPITIVGSFLVLLINLPIPGFADFMTSIFGDTWIYFLNSIYNLTVPLLSIYSLVGIIYAYCKYHDYESILYIILGLLTFFVLTPGLTDESGLMIANGLNMTYFGPKGMFMSIAIGLLLPSIMTRLENIKYLKISMPEEVPSAVASSFNKLIPISVFALLIGLLNSIFVIGFNSDIFTFTYNMFQTPIREIVGTSYLGGFVSLFFTNLAWFFGLHGGLLMSPINQIAFGELMPANIDAFASGQAIPYLFTGIPFFEVFSKMGGAGCGLALIVSVKLFSKNQGARKICALALIPALFNIVEPIVFGLPIVFNPIMIIPFVIVPLITYSLAYVFTILGFMAPLVIQVPWTIPIGINSFISTGGDFVTVIFQLIIFAVAVLVYAPFIKMWDKSVAKQAELEKEETSK